MKPTAGHPCDGRTPWSLAREQLVVPACVGGLLPVRRLFMS